MTFQQFVAQHCDVLPEATGDKAIFIADRFLTKSGQRSDPVTQRQFVDVMRGEYYFQRGYSGATSLRMRPYQVF